MPRAQERAQNATRSAGTADGPRRKGARCGFRYLPLSLSLVGVELFVMLSLGDAEVVPGAIELDDEDDGADEPLGAMLLDVLELLPDGVLVVADDELLVSVDDELVDGLIVPVLEVELDGDVVLGVVVLELEAVDGVVDGVVVVDEVLLVSR